MGSYKTVQCDCAAMDALKCFNKFGLNFMLTGLEVAQFLPSESKQWLEIQARITEHPCLLSGCLLGAIKLGETAAIQTFRLK